jgi:streptogramin lyase
MLNRTIFTAFLLILAVAVPATASAAPARTGAIVFSMVTEDHRTEVEGRIDLSGGDSAGGPIAVGPDPGAVAVGSDAVWVANNGDGTVTRIEP